jgi:hypothetical protein
MELAAFCLVGYYAAWICYYSGVADPWIFVSMAVLPSIYFILVELMLKNYIALIPSMIFGITHITITCINYIL